MRSTKRLQTTDETATKEPKTSNRNAQLSQEVVDELDRRDRAIEDRLLKLVGALGDAVTSKVSAAIDQKIGEVAAPLMGMLSGEQNDDSGDRKQPARKARAGIMKQMPAANMKDAIAMMAMDFLSAQMQQPPPVQDARAKIHELAELKKELDVLYGGNNAGGPGFSPNNALSWAKWGWEQAKAGAPAPAFPTQREHVPPSGSTG